MIEKIDGFKKIPEQSFTTKESEHILSCFSLSPISSFRSIENKHDVNRGKDCMKKFCGSLIEYAMKLISFRAARIRSKLRSLLYLSRKIWKKYLKDKIYRKVRDYCYYTEEYRGAVHSIWN